MGFIGYADQLIAGGGSNDLGIRSQDEIRFATGGNTERMRLSATGEQMVYSNGTVLHYEQQRASSGSAGDSLLYTQLIISHCMLLVFMPFPRNGSASSLSDRTQKEKY